MKPTSAANQPRKEIPARTFCSPSQSQPFGHEWVLEAVFPPGDHSDKAAGFRVSVAEPLRNLPDPEPNQPSPSLSFGVRRSAGGTRTAAAIAVSLFLSCAANVAQASPDGAVSTEVVTALVGRDVELTLQSGVTVVGELVAASASAVVLAQQLDGKVVKLPRSDVVGIAVARTPAPAPPSHAAGRAPASSYGGPLPGKALRDWGIVLTVVGGASLGTAVAYIAASYFTTFGWPPAVLGAAGLGAGIPMIKKGQRQMNEAANRAAVSQVRVSPGGLTISGKF